MVLNLKNFEQLVESKIVDRGFHYYEYDQVTGVEQVDEREFCAEVVGSEEYTVFVKLNKDLDVIDHSCDCPYDWGNVCKHRVAVFYYIKDAELYKQPLSESSFNEMKKELVSYDKKELAELILNMAKRSGKFREDLRWELGLEG